MLIIDRRLEFVQRIYMLARIPTKIAAALFRLGNISNVLTLLTSRSLTRVTWHLFKESVHVLRMITFVQIAVNRLSVRRKFYHKSAFRTRDMN